MHMPVRRAGTGTEPAPGVTGHRRRMWVALVALAALAGAACGAGSRGGSRDGPTAGVAHADRSPKENIPSALSDADDPALPKPLVDMREVISGGPPPDGIPAIDAPRFQAVAAVDWLRDREPVLALEIDGDARAYPIQVMTWHEIVNDTVGSAPVTVTYCPLCNSALAYDRRVGERVLDFGTSGRLFRSALVMYDRQTESLWAHFLGQAIAGVLTGTELETYPVSTVSWADFRRAHPEGRVLSRDTGHTRSYGTNPYPGYDDVGTAPFLLRGTTDGRLEAKARVVGVRQGTEEAVAVVLDGLARAGVVRTSLGRRPITVWHAPGTASALDDRALADGRDVGATGVFDPVLDGVALEFRAAGDGTFLDIESNSRWDILGRAIEGPHAGRRLSPVDHVDTFWFAWAAYLPATSIVPAGAPR